MSTVDAAVLDPMVFPLLELPPETILEIAMWGQELWLLDCVFAYGPGGPFKRLVVDTPLNPDRQEECCRNVEERVLPTCISADSLVPQSPVHSLACACRSLRDLLQSSQGAWKQDNLFFKSVVAKVTVRQLSPSPTNLVEPSIAYGSRTLIASPSCACIIPNMLSFFRSLVSLKLAVPWHRPSLPHSDNEHFFLANHDEDACLLQRFDLEIYESTQAPIQSIIHCLYTDTMLSCRIVRASFFYTSPCLTSLFIYIPMNRMPAFENAFWDGLMTCSSSLEYLTLDVGGAIFIGGDTFITLPKLLYLKLVAGARECPRFLQALNLPSLIDMHLEPVVDWRAGAWARIRRHMLDDEPVPIHVDFQAIESPDFGDQGPRQVWRFLCALAAPDQTEGIFHIPSHFNFRQTNWQTTVNVVGLDVRLDPSTRVTERACARFPELIALDFGTTVRDVEMQFLARDHPKPPYLPSPLPSGRRTLTFRDGVLAHATREHYFDARLVTPLYDTLSYIMRVVMKGGSGAVAFDGLRHARTLVLHARSWKPAFSIGWANLLEGCTRVENLVLYCDRILSVDEVFDERAEGPLAATQLESLAIYLSSTRVSSAYPCRNLQSVHIKVAAGLGDGAASFAAHWQSRFNTRARLRGVGQLISFLVTSPSIPTAQAADFV
ncbi:unnamed protein product [Peniophora sp. CBMAI 1063]|nr:unnamed protein product [Peniophora sp. CBMAI 1063]